MFNFMKPKMVNGVLFITTDGSVGDYVDKARKIGFKCNSRDVHYCIDMLNCSERWLNEEHTKAKVGFKGDRKAWDVVKKLEFVFATSEEVAH